MENALNPLLRTAYNLSVLSYRHELPLRFVLQLLSEFVSVTLFRVRAPTPQRLKNASRIYQSYRVFMQKLLQAVFYLSFVSCSDEFVVVEHAKSQEACTLIEWCYRTFIRV